MRRDGRQADQMRPVKLTPDYLEYPAGSVLVEFGSTRVLCAATLEAGVPRWMAAQNKPGGWITAEYAMLPASTQERTPRETRGPSGRTQEIRRLIGRSLRAAVDLKKLDGYTLTIDCDVLQADGGTRTASITGGYAALAIAVRRLGEQTTLPSGILRPAVAAVSVGMFGSVPLLDLDYAEDSAAEVDLNIVMNAEGNFIEIQGTAEEEPFSQPVLDSMLALARKGIGELLAQQQACIQAA